MSDVKGLRSITEVLNELQDKVNSMEQHPKRMGLNLDFIHNTMSLKQKKQERELDKIKTKYYEMVAERYPSIDECMLPQLCLLAMDFIEINGHKIAKVLEQPLSSELKATSAVSLVSHVFDTDPEMIFNLISTLVEVQNRHRKSSLFRSGTIKKSK